MVVLLHRPRRPPPPQQEVSQAEPAQHGGAQPRVEGHHHQHQQVGHRHLRRVQEGQQQVPQGPDATPAARLLPPRGGRGGGGNLRRGGLQRGLLFIK